MGSYNYIDARVLHSDSGTKHNLVEKRMSLKNLLNSLGYLTSSEQQAPIPTPDEIEGSINDTGDFLMDIDSLEMRIQGGLHELSSGKIVTFPQPFRDSTTPLFTASIHSSTSLGTFLQLDASPTNLQVSLKANTISALGLVNLNVTVGTVFWIALGKLPLT